MQTVGPFFLMRPVVNAFLDTDIAEGSDCGGRPESSQSA